MTKPPETPDNRSAWEKAQPERKNCEECGWPHDACCCEPVPARAYVYSGPHYGMIHKITGRSETLVHVEYHGDKFSVPLCDIEEIQDCCDEKKPKHKSNCNYANGN